MSTSICPYCRGAINTGAEEAKICPGCGTPHHADCFEENGGCTVFGCSAAPAEEPKLSLTATELASGVSNAATPRVASSLPSTLHLEPSTQQAAVTPVAPRAHVRVKAPPPPMPNSSGVATVPAVPIPTPRYGSNSILFGVQPVAAVATAVPAADLDFDLEDNPDAKNRITFIVLGVLLGMFGAHNFYAGFTKKGIAQICITVLSMGFASPMVWVWAVIDVCTVFSDSKGIKFRS